MTMRRRSVLLQAAGLGAGATAIAIAIPGWAQTAAASGLKMKALGVFALLGDSVQVAVADGAPTDTRIERTNRDVMEFKGIGFDDIVLRQASRWLKREQPTLSLQMYKPTALITPDEQQALAEGAARGELPAWIVNSIVAKQLDHVLLVTRARGPVNARSGGPGSETVGRSIVQGVGFYIDVFFKTRNDQTGATAEGLLAPYTKIKLSLMDTHEAKVVREYLINEAFVTSPKESMTVADPWTYMDNAEKVRILRQMVSDGIERALPAVFRAS